MGLLSEEDRAVPQYRAPRQVTLREDIQRLGGLLSSFMPDAWQHGGITGAARNTDRALQGGHWKLEYGPNGEVYQTDEWVPYDGSGMDRLMGVMPLAEFAGASGVAAPFAKVPQGSLFAFGDIGNIKGKHASPHKFDKFDLSHIGKGEGAQAYGHGGYLAESDRVIDEYFNTFKSRPNQFDYRDVSVDGKSAEDLYSEALARINRGDMSAEAEYNFWEGVVSGQHPEEVIAAFKDSPEDFGEGALAFVQKLEKSDMVAPENLTPRAYRYEVELDAKPEEMLDWDKPLSEQHEAVKNTASDLFLSDIGTYTDLEGKTRYTYYDGVERKYFTSFDEAKKHVLSGKTGQDAYYRISGGFNDSPQRGDAAASQALRKQGIKGIRYLDGNSRGKGEGTYNYVFFDDKDALIHTRDGEPIKGLLSEGGDAFGDVSDKTIESLKRYWSSRVWPSPEDARKQIADRIERDNSRLLFGQPTNPAAVERLEFVKSGKGYKISQRGTTKRAPITVAEHADSAPPVDWTAGDLGHDGTPSSVMKVYGRGVGEVRSGYIPADQIPKPKLAGGKTGYSWDEIDKGGPYPAPTVRLNKNGTLSILDGNHRIHRWLEEGHEHIPAYIIDERNARPRNAEPIKGLLAD